MTTIPALTPFDDPEGDVILRSSDRVDFRFFKNFLSKASEVFSSLFQVPSPSESTSPSDYIDGVPLVQVAETSRVLDILLRFCHPALRHPRLLPEDIMGVYKAAEKYDIMEAVAWARESTLSLMETHPMGVFIVAYHLGWEEEAKASAKRLLRVPLLEVMDKTGTELDSVPARVLGAFWSYRKECGKKAAEACNIWDSDDITDQDESMREDDPVYKTPLWCNLFLAASTCCYTKYMTNIGGIAYTRPWVDAYLQDVRRAVQDRPWEELARDETMIAKAVKGAQACRECGPQAYDLMQSFIPEVMQSVGTAIESVRALLFAFLIGNFANAFIPRSS